MQITIGSKQAVAAAVVLLLTACLLDMRGGGATAREARSMLAPSRPWT